MSNLRPAREWLNELEPGYRERAIANCEKFPQFPEVEVNSVAEAIEEAFHWQETPEGSSFWRAVFRHYNAMPIPSLPKLPTE